MKEHKWGKKDWNMYMYTYICDKYERRNKRPPDNNIV